MFIFMNLWCWIDGDNQRWFFYDSKKYEQTMISLFTIYVNSMRSWYYCLSSYRYLFLMNCPVTICLRHLQLAVYRTMSSWQMLPLTKSLKSFPDLHLLMFQMQLQHLMFLLQIRSLGSLKHLHKVWHGGVHVQVEITFLSSNILSL